MFELVADFIIATEKREFFEKAAIVQELKRLYRLRKWRAERKERGEPEGDESADNFSEKNRRKYLRVYLDKVEEALKGKNFLFRDLQDRALDEVVREVLEKRRGMNLNEKKLKKIMQNWIDTNSAGARWQLNEMLEKAYDKTIREAWDYYSKGVFIPSLDACDMQRDLFFKHLIYYQIPEEKVRKAEEKFKERLVQIYESEINLKCWLEQDCNSGESVREIMMLFQGNDLAKLLFEAEKINKKINWKRAEQEKHDIGDLLAIRLEKSIERIVDLSLASAAPVKQSAREVKEIEKESDELKARYDDLPEDLKKESGFRKQLDEQLAQLNRKRKGLLGGTLNAVNFFTEYEPNRLYEKMKEVFVLYRSEQRFKDLWARLVKMFDEQPTYTKGANPEWNRAGEIGKIKFVLNQSRFQD